VVAQAIGKIAKITKIAKMTKTTKAKRPGLWLLTVPWVGRQ
jgi:hypothetical protein